MKSIVSRFVLTLFVVIANGSFGQMPGTVLSHQKISSTEGGFAGPLDNGDGFGNDVASLGDLDGDGVGDLAVGATRDDDGGTDRGAVWILFLNSDQTVKSRQKISDTEGGFTGTLDDVDAFGNGLSSLGDLDGDGVNDLAVGTPGDDDGGTNRGAVWVLFLDNDGTVKSQQKISQTEGGFTDVLGDTDELFGVTSLGDLDGDGVGDMAVGAGRHDDGGSNRGAVWILFLNSDGTVKDQQEISDTEGGFTGMLDDEDRFGIQVAALGDLDGDGVGDLAVGADRDDDGGADLGAVWVLFLNSDGTVKNHQKISSTAGGFSGSLDTADGFSLSLAALGDLDGDGVGELAVGARWDDDGGTDRGAVWVLFLNSDGTVKSHQKISSTEGGFTGPLNDSDAFGRGLASLGDADGDGVGDLAAGAFRDDDGGSDRGAAWILFLDGVTRPTLSIPGRPGAAPGEPVEIPIDFTAYGHDIAAATFSIDYDETCLAFDPTDADADGLPDAIAFSVPAAFDVTVFTDLGDTDGEIDVAVFDLPPIATLPDGLLATLTLDTLCDPAPDPGLQAPVLFSLDPPASFGDTEGGDVPGVAEGNLVKIVAGTRGDCNNGGDIGAGDIGALGLEIFDGDGAFWLDTPGGGFPGNPVGCDANADTAVDAGDVSCVIRLIFDLPCAAEEPFEDPGSLPRNGPRLRLPAHLPPPADGTVTATIHYSAQGHAINSVVGSLDFDQSLLSFNPADDDGDGLPDAVRFPGAEGFLRSVIFVPSDSRGELDILITDLTPTPQTLADGPLMEIDFVLLRPAGNVDDAVLFAAQPPVSFGDISGQSVAGTAAVVLFADGFETGDTSAWSRTTPAVP